MDSYVLWCNGIGGELEITVSGKQVWKVEEMWDEMHDEEEDGYNTAVVAALVTQERWREHMVQRRHDADTMVVMETLEEMKSGMLHGGDTQKEKGARLMA